MKILLKRKVLASVTLSVAVVVLAVLFGGSKSKGTSPPPSRPEVEVVQVEQRDVPIYGEWIGTLDGMVNAEIKAQVAGYLLTQNYAEGSLVKKGQLLFEIDPRPFQAALDQAKGDLARAEGQLSQANGQLSQSQAQLAQAEANQRKTQLDEDRFTALVTQAVISKEQFDNAVQANLAAKAQVKAARAGVETSTAAISAAKAAVEAAKAAVQTAALNLGFTKITSPIDGIAGIAQAQVGNLIQPNNPNSGALTTVSTLDPIKAYFTLSEQEYLRFVKRNPTQTERDEANQNLQLDLVLADGTTYPHKGKFFVADREVDQKTGSIRLAAVFPNPGNTLRPGQYGKVQAVTRIIPGALLVPQRAVTELQGTYQVAVVDPDNKVNIRSVKIGERVDTMWIIEAGLKPGENVVAEGTQRVRPGTEVTPRPFATGDLSSDIH
ncbi:MAG TPA: efflux RND transporter periplasmic adaptor subunit [Blastocatellia bacterium]|nr:efflux RND transporter periplasmic adaptor subunit [Blastocatellia bacterium]